ncbi:MAG: hypothetical protein CMJ75_14620 [Planctomycetaceae bacterium]|nr:hypothetical protein [Planctomycetaceae bacterium]
MVQRRMHLTHSVTGCVREPLVLFLLAMYCASSYVLSAAAEESVDVASPRGDNLSGCLAGVQHQQSGHVKRAVAVAVPKAKPISRPAVSFRDGERIVWLGASFVERMQLNGYLEAWLTASFPDRDILFRNLGWSGDTVYGAARALFGKPTDGFARLIRDVKRARPTTLVVVYGGNEAYAGKSGVDLFSTGLESLLDALDSIKTKIVLVAPHCRATLPPPLPDPTRYNRDLVLYRNAMAGIAERRMLAFVDLHDLMRQLPAEPVSTHDGVQLTVAGYRAAAPWIASKLGAQISGRKELRERGEFQDQSGWWVKLEQRHLTSSPVTQVSELKVNAQGVSFLARDKRLYFAGSSLSGEGSSRGEEPQRMPRLVAELPEGAYELRLDTTIVVTARSHQEWARGVSFVHQAARQQWEALRQAIRIKNELYFHRYRPQNETYLYLFRKNEQGNNAVEIPQFDGLVKERDQRIAKLRVPQTHRFELVRVVAPQP